MTSKAAQSHSTNPCATFPAAYWDQLNRWAAKHPHWETELTNNVGRIDPEATPSQFIIIHLPGYFAVNDIIGSNGWFIYPSIDRRVAVVFGDNDPVIFPSLGAALSEIEKLHSWVATDEDRRLAETIVPAFKVLRERCPRKAA